MEFNRFGTIEGADYYTLLSGEITITASGLDGSGISGCQQQGSNANRKLPGGSVEVTPIGSDGGAPYEYAISVDMPFEALNITRINCNKASQEEGFEGTEYPLTPAYKFAPWDRNRPTESTSPAPKTRASVNSSTSSTGTSMAPNRQMQR